MLPLARKTSRLLEETMSAPYKMGNSEVFKVHNLHELTDIL